MTLNSLKFCRICRRCPCSSAFYPSDMYICCKCRDIEARGRNLNNHIRKKLTPFLEEIMQRFEIYQKLSKDDWKQTLNLLLDMALFRYKRVYLASYLWSNRLYAESSADSNIGFERLAYLCRDALDCEYRQLDEVHKFKFQCGVSTSLMNACFAQLSNKSEGQRLVQGPNENLGTKMLDYLISRIDVSLKSVLKPCERLGNSRICQQIQIIERNTSMSKGLNNQRAVLRDRSR
jgi:hypothetical protein